MQIILLPFFFDEVITSAIIFQVDKNALLTTKYMRILRIC